MSLSIGPLPSVGPFTSSLVLSRFWLLDSSCASRSLDLGDADVAPLSATGKGYTEKTERLILKVDHVLVELNVFCVYSRWEVGSAR